MPDKLDKFLEKSSHLEISSIPIIFDLSQDADRQALAGMVASAGVTFVRDEYEDQLKELFQIDHPTLVYTPDFAPAFARYLEGVMQDNSISRAGRWAYYPWLSTLTHILEAESFQMVRTARNRNLITAEEQEKFYNAVVGIAGLSVGNSAALALVLQGGARHIRLADHDRLALTNTNRLRSSVAQIGLPKVTIAARQIYEINPYATVDLYTTGLTLDNLDTFFAGPPALDLIIDELDTMPIKYAIREKASARRVPVLMGADNGDNAIVDVERYDKEPNTAYFNGALGEISYQDLLQLDKFELARVITKLLGPENITPRMQASLLEIGKTIVSWPQLGGAAILNGAALAYCARKIILGEDLPSGRTLVSFDSWFEPNYHTPSASADRLIATEEFKNRLGL